MTRYWNGYRWCESAEHVPVKNRMARARERAGLTIGQAAKLLDIPSGVLLGIEERDADFEAISDQHEHIADMYGVNAGWLSGDKELHDYEAMKDVRGWDDLSMHDRDVVAEFAASLPPAKPCKRCGEVGCNPIKCQEKP